MTTYLTLYVSGTNPRTSEAIRRTKEILSRSNVDCRVDVVDILEDPAAAEEDRIIATPTIIRTEPPPIRKIVGDISDSTTLLYSLGLTADPF